jgi:hypothetical protein
MTNQGTLHGLTVVVAFKVGALRDGGEKGTAMFVGERARFHEYTLQLHRNVMFLMLVETHIGLQEVRSIFHGRRQAVYKGGEDAHVGKVCFATTPQFHSCMDETHVITP